MYLTQRPQQICSMNNHSSPIKVSTGTKCFQYFNRKSLFSPVFWGYKTRGDEQNLIHSLLLAHRSHCLNSLHPWSSHTSTSTEKNGRRKRKNYRSRRRQVGSFRVRTLLSTSAGEKKAEAAAAKITRLAPSRQLPTLSGDVTSPETFSRRGLSGYFWRLETLRAAARTLHPSSSSRLTHSPPVRPPAPNTTTTRSESVMVKEMVPSQPQADLLLLDGGTQ